MRRFGCLALAMVPGLVVAACTSSSAPEADQEEVEVNPDGEEHPDGHPDDGSGSGSGSGSSEHRPFRVSVDVSNPDCNQSLIQYEVWGTYEDGSPVTDLECAIDLGDGSVATNCVGTHAMPGDMNYELKVVAHDRIGGGSAEAVRPFYVYEPPFIEATVTAPACGLEVSWSADRSRLSEFNQNISPAENLVSYDPAARKFIVNAAGTYTVHFAGEQERSNGPICQVSVDKTVEVKSCDDPHEHEPECKH